MSAPPEADLVAEALSLDGRTFHLEGPVDTPWVPGDLLVLSTRQGRQICAQLLAKDQSTPGKATGTGSVLGRVDADGGIVLGNADPFTGATIASASEKLLADLQDHAGADMAVGTSRVGEAKLRRKGFNRHTFMCGQSGSGKSYALGVLLEQLLVDTDVPLVILDPNADFVTLNQTLPATAGHERQRLDDATVNVFRPQAGPDHEQLLVRFTRMSFEAKAAIFQLDSLKERAEYNVLVHLEELMATRDPKLVMQDLLASADPDERAMGQRIENLGLLDWGIWARDRAALLDDPRPFPRVTVLDLSGFEHPRERMVASLALLNDLWEHREERQPVLLVIDEAHNVCPSRPSDPLEVATSERLIQIANEGRKYGIWLLLCTQRPSRIHEGVLSQCDNLVLMRMNSRGDLAQLEATFGFAPAEMLQAAPYFRQGECLMAGTFIPAPTFVQMGSRRTREGGSDVRIPLPATGDPS
jgi:DNA helicase HerA-like ATPase